MYNILICDDEKDIVNALKIYLSDPSYTIFEAYDGAEALALVKNEDIHLVLTDIMMPVRDGISFVSELRKTSNIPVILLSAKSEDTDKILGLNIGADDYITKPFNPVEVCARVRSQLRRYFQLGGGKARPETFVCGGIELNDESKQVTVDAERIRYPPSAHFRARKGFFSEGDIQKGMEGHPAEQRQHRCRPYPPFARKDRDRSVGTALS